MDDRRLVWNQVKAPDLSGASRALARANQSFTGAFESAQGIIAKYGEGQKFAGDQELSRLLASATNQEELDSLVNSDAVRNLNLSENGINMLNAAQGNRVNWANTRSQIGSRDGLLGIAQATEGRTAATYADNVERRDFARGNAGNAIAASEFARANGETVGPITETGGPRNIQYRNAIANIESDGSGGYKAIGPTNEKLGRALGRYQIMEGNLPQWSKEALGREVTAEEFMANPEIQDAIFDKKFGQYVNQFGEEGAAQAWFGGAGGVGKTNRTDSLGRINIGQYGQQFVANLQNGTQRQSPTDAYRQSLVDSGLFTAAEIAQRMAPINDAAQQRTSELDARDSDIVAEQIAAANQEILNDPNILNTEQAINAISGDTRFTATENEKRINQIRALIDESPTRVAPTTPGTPALDANIANTIAAADNALNSTDQNRAIGDIGNFAEDPAGQLSEELGLATDNQQAGVIGSFIANVFGKGGNAKDQNQLRNMINDYARRLNVEPAVVAVAMRDSFNRDPFSIAGFNANTLGNRFEFNDVKTAVEQLDQQSIRNYRERKSNNELLAIELSALKTQAQNLQRQIAKTNSPSQKQALESQLAALNSQVAIIEERRK